MTAPTGADSHRGFHSEPQKVVVFRLPLGRPNEDRSPCGSQPTFSAMNGPIAGKKHSDHSSR